ncbi:hypothetical protein I8748_05555 [Nostoc sp. CENA67]|uniref:Uncharacterized protein n=1 Tax=Amazonocrinis nigriterrae CENA67 TaxID=2794033 RepID=A0A8J7L5W0_9NOST|nr:hypothetical protein [Amazonocrinis nigriterrae]MBH8561649.1 hypothetical protein [Amazonocrinis nigriterrae CENA67]
MAEPTLTDVFGAGATQTATTLTIVKADLPGLTASANNTAESLLAGIAKKAAVTLTEDNRDNNADQSIAINLEEGLTVTNRTINGVSTRYERRTIAIELDKVYGSTGIDPDDY